MLTSTYPRWAGDSEPAFVHELCKRLSPNYDLVVLAPHAPGARVREQLDGIPVYRYRYLPQAWETLAYAGGIPAKLSRNPLRLLQVPFFCLAQFLAAWRLIRTNGIDLLHAHWLLPQGLTAVLLKSLRPRLAVVCTVHGADLYTLNSRPLRWLKSWVLRRVDVLCLVSRAMLPAAMALGAREEATRIAPMGVGVSFPFSAPPDGVRSHGSVLYVGRLVEKKGVRHLLDALAMVRERKPTARLTIVGDGPERGVLERQVRQLGLADRVEFTGAKPQGDLCSYYQSAAVTVFPSVIASGGDQEGFGLVVVEAQACACPVIASDLPVLREIIEDGDTGILVRPGDSSALARAILRVLDDRELAQRLGARGRQAAVERFDWDRVSAGYDRIFQQGIAVTQERGQSPA